MSRLIPKLSVRDADAAIAWYARALGATCTARYAMGETVVLATLDIDGAALEVKTADGTDPAAEDLDGSPVIFTLEVDDPIATADRMVAAGAEVRFPVEHQPYGKLQGRVVDPFGLQWLLSKDVEHLTPQEVQARLDSWAQDSRAQDS